MPKPRKTPSLIVFARLVWRRFREEHCEANLGLSLEEMFRRAAAGGEPSALSGQPQTFFVLDDG